MSHPPFPDNVPTHLLFVIDYELIKAHDELEINRLWEAGRKLGFWYLKNHGTDKEVNDMFEMGVDTLELPLEEKMKFEQGDGGRSFGYKAAGANAVDASGRPDTVEFMNIAKDDARAWPRIARREYPKTVNERMESTVIPFIQKSLEVHLTILNIFNERLGLQPGELLRRHSLEEFSGSEARVIRNLVNQDSNRPAIGSHTDFGTLSSLHNRLGGLQVLIPGDETWQYVKPIPGHAICNIGDALAIFSGGILRSNVHRVLPPPGEQSKYERWSLVYFTRPGDSVLLNALVNESAMIADAIAKCPERSFYTRVTSYEWFSRRIKYQRIKNRKGPETWMASRGTEEVED